MERGDIVMKQFIKYAIVGATGYLVGIYRIKYTVYKAIATKKAEDKIAEEETEES